VDDLAAQRRAVAVLAGDVTIADVHRWSDLGPMTPIITTGVRLLGERADDTGAPGAPDLTATLTCRGETEPTLWLEVDDRLGSSAAERLLGHVVNVLGALCDAPATASVVDLDMLDAAERHRLLHEWNPPSPTPAAATVVEAFDAAVRRGPDRLALRVAGAATTLTFAELDARANRLAHAIRRHRVGPDDRVAICLARSPEFVVAMLAVLKSGAAYVPVDPSYPDHVVRHMLLDSGASLLVTDAVAAADIVPTLAEHGVATVLVDLDAATIAAEPDAAPTGTGLMPHHLAYVIYTSGSTGTPKGVAVEHRALAAYCAAITDEYDLTDGDRVLQFAGLSFDVSIEEVLPTLLCGATLVLRDDTMVESMRTLLDVVRAEQLSVLNLPSAYWHLLVQHLEETAEAPGCGLAASVRLVVVGGDKPARWAYDVWRRHAPGVRWLNGYGPTEATVTCSVYDGSVGEVAPGRELPIGRPVANARLYVLGHDGSLLPEGVAGELWVGGASVARGYLGRHDLTSRRFRADPFATVDDPAAPPRMYGTGDLARWSADGQLEFLGRLDRQIKLRGFRMEPGEIEAVLASDPSIGQAFVAVHRVGDRETLTAWVVPANGEARVEPDAVLARMRPLLPDHMIPAAVVALERLPITPGGKIDAAALPAPPVRGRGASTTSDGDLDGEDDLADVDQTEALVRRLFADVLGVERVGADESFFDLGGQSLLAVRLIDRIERATGRRISLPTLFGGPTPRELARALRDLDSVSQYDYLLPIQPNGDRPPLIGVHVLGTNAEFYKPLAEHLGPDQPVFGLSISNPGIDTPTDVRMIARLYAAELCRFHPYGPLHLAAVSLGAFVAFELAQQLWANGRKVVTLAMFDAAGPGPAQQVGRAERVRQHLRRTRERGLGYLVGVVTTPIRQAVARFRLAAYGRMRRPMPDSLWELKFVQANEVAADNYDIVPYPGSITVFHAQDEVFDAPEFKRSGLGWGGFAEGGIDVVGVPGGHLSMLAEPNVEVLAAELRKAMGRQAGEPGAD
jgi:amino acid adenylation domain-containing protein